MTNVLQMLHDTFFSTILVETEAQRTNSKDITGK